MNMTTSLENIRALTLRSQAISAQLAPVNQRIAVLTTEVAVARDAITAAGAALDAADTRLGFVEGQLLQGKATAKEADEAKKARQDAQKAQNAAQSNAAWVRSMSNEIVGLKASAQDLTAQGVAVAVRHQAATKQYMFDLANEAAVEYRFAADLLAAKAAALLGLHQVFFNIGLGESFLGMGFWNLNVASIELPGARKLNGQPLVTIDTAKAMKPAAIADVRARLLADGVTVAGLT
jgi:hypothetical protein